MSSSRAAAAMLRFVTASTEIAPLYAFCQPIVLTIVASTSAVAATARIVAGESPPSDIGGFGGGGVGCTGWCFAQ